jgi:hypothetical protein
VRAGLTLGINNILLFMRVTTLEILGAGSCAAMVAVVDGWVLRLYATLNRGIRL